MSGSRDRFSEELCNAFVDGELDARDRAELLAAIGEDPALAARLASIGTLKDMVRTAYAEVGAAADAASVPSHAASPGEDAPAASGARIGRRPHARVLGAALAASLVALAGGWIGWQIGAAQGGGGSLASAGAVSVVPAQRGLGTAHVSSLAAAHSARAERVLVHLSSGDRDDMDATLRGVESLLEAARSENRTLAVELVVNSRGVELVLAGVTPHAEWIASLQRRYPELALVACNQTLARLREDGANPQLLPGVQRAVSAVDEVVRRLHEGWLYVRT